MKKFTDTKTVTAVTEMSAEPEQTIEHTIPHDSIYIADDETISLSYFSNAKAKRIEEYYSEYPTNEDIEALIKKHEKCDYVTF